jgi:hypothetical protein
MIGATSFVIAAALVAPSFAAKKAVSDEELDMVTAAGQPVIIQGGPVTVSFLPTTDISSVIQPDSQASLRALALNNVVGENQVANGINIAGGTNGQSSANNIIQSWGSTADLTIVTAKGGAATASFTCSETLTLICKVTATATPGATNRIRAGVAADQIIHSTNTMALTYSPTTAIAATIEGGSQSTLVALVVNNVTGLNQVGNGVNLASGSITLGPDLVIGPGGVGGGAAPSQSNLLGAYRGTPQNFSRTP